MQSASVQEVIKNIGDIGLTGKYNSGPLQPMGLTGPTTNPFLSIPEPGAAYLASVRGGRRRRRGRSSRRKTTRRRRSTRR